MKFNYLILIGLLSLLLLVAGCNKTGKAFAGQAVFTDVGCVEGTYYYEVNGELVGRDEGCTTMNELGELGTENPWCPTQTVEKDGKQVFVRARGNWKWCDTSAAQEAGGVGSSEESKGDSSEAAPETSEDTMAIDDSYKADVGNVPVVACSVGAPAPSKCVSEGGYSWSYYNMTYELAADGTCSVVKKNVIAYCGYDTCDDVKGCCSKKLVPNSISCQGTIFSNVTENSCTQQQSKSTTDCKEFNKYINGEAWNYTCVSKLAQQAGENPGPWSGPGDVCQKCGKPICEAGVASGSTKKGDINVPWSGGCKEAYPYDAQWKQMGVVNGTGCPGY